MAFDLSDYKDVPARIADFKAKHPEGCLRPADPAVPYRVETIGAQTFIVFVAAAFRTPDDLAPGIGSAWEPFPGLTAYTKNSELQNAETSAWGRAICAVLASESKNVASQEDVRNRRAESDPAADAAREYAATQKDMPGTERVKPQGDGPPLPVGGGPSCAACGKSLAGAKVQVRKGERFHEACAGASAPGGDK